MFARRFFRVSLGILALSVAYHLGAERAGGDWQPSAPGRVRGTTAWGGNTWIAIGTNGELVLLNGSTGWDPSGYPPLPPGVTMADVKYFEGTSGGHTLLVTNADVAWTSAAGDAWISHGEYPGTPIPAKSTSCRRGGGS
jgi:hypothetical protein